MAKRLREKEGGTQESFYVVLFLV